MSDEENRVHPEERRLVGRKDIADYSGSWAIAALIAAVVLIVGVLIFSAVGPDSTRTAAYNAKPNSQSQTSEPRGRAKVLNENKIPNETMPTAPRAP
jgi:hypothetical protein